MRPVRVETQEGNRLVNEILRQHPGHEGLAHPALFTANQMYVRHKLTI